ncbi:MAG: METTL5 family protein [Thermoplasmatota archaeon]
MRRSELAARLAAVPRHPTPDPALEQYRTPEEVAAGLLWLAAEDGAIRDRNVLDLGCGTGLFAVGAALLGARLATGVDVDLAAVAIAREAAEAAGVGKRCWFVASGLAAWHADPATFDTVVMNPPFGAQAENRHADRLFLARAAEAVRDRKGTVWFLAQERTERFLVAFAAELGGRLERVASWDYPLQAQFGFHAEEARVVLVGGYRLGFG